MRFDVLIETVCVQHHLVAKNLVITAQINAPALAFRVGGGEFVEVEMIRPTQPILIVTCRGQPVREVRCRREFISAGIQIQSTSSRRDVTAQLKVIRTGIRTYKRWPFRKTTIMVEDRVAVIIVQNTGHVGRIITDPENR